MFRQVMVLLALTLPARAQTIESNKFDCSTVLNGDVTSSSVQTVCGIPPDQVVRMLEMATSGSGEDYRMLVQMLEQIWPDAQIAEIQELRTIIRQLQTGSISDAELAGHVAGIVEKQLSRRKTVQLFDCVPTGGMSGDPVDRSILFHNRGQDFRRRGLLEQAAVCLIAATHQYALNLDSYNSLADMKFYGEPRDQGAALYYLSRAVYLTISQIDEIDYSKVKGMLDFGGAAVPPCDVQRNITGDNINWTALQLQLDIFKEIGRMSEALEDYAQALTTYPRQSCVYHQEIGREATVAARKACTDPEQIDYAVAFYELAAGLGHFSGARARSNQEFLQKQGYDVDVIDSQFGSKSTLALLDWARNGCVEY